jgi:putative hydrolase of the HAD superfamily
MANMKIITLNARYIKGSITQADLLWPRKEIIKRNIKGDVRMIKGFLFDYDGVMTAQSGGNNPSELLGKLPEMNGDKVGQLFMSFWPDYLRGKINESDLWRMIEAKSGKTVAPTQRQIWTRWEDLRPLPEMQQLVADLRREGSRVGLLTNVTPTTEEGVRAHGGYEGFDFLIRSCKVGFAKPDVEIYELAMSYLPGLKPEEVVFIDDREQCLAPARELGIHTILATGTAQVRSAIRGLRATNLPSEL